MKTFVVPPRLFKNKAYVKRLKELLGPDTEIIRDEKVPVLKKLPRF